MNKETRLILYGIKYIIERDNFTPVIKKKLDKDICNAIVEMINPTIKEEPCCPMEEKVKKQQKDLEEFAKRGISE